MLNIVLDAGNAFALRIVLGWSRDPKLISKPDALVHELETIPMCAFLQHVASTLREPVVAVEEADPLTKLLLEGQIDAINRHAALRADLQNLGFGAHTGNSTFDAMVREFQISASGFVATALRSTISDVQLRKRDYRNLKRIPNTANYAGPLSGRANLLARLCIDEWKAGGLHNPLIITGFKENDIVNGRPKAGAIQVVPDIWMREETLGWQAQLLCD